MIIYNRRGAFVDIVMRFLHLGGFFRALVNTGEVN